MKKLIIWKCEIILFSLGIPNDPIINLVFITFQIKDDMQI